MVFDNAFDTVKHDRHFSSLWQQKAQLVDSEQSTDDDVLPTTLQPDCNLADCASINIPEILHEVFHPPEPIVFDSEGDPDAATANPEPPAPPAPPEVLRPALPVQASEGAQRYQVEERQLPALIAPQGFSRSGH